jgi:hypothetical protein
MDNRIYVPPELRLKVLKIYHDASFAGYYEKLRTQKLVKRNYFWPRMASYIKKYVKSCHSCARNKLNTYKVYGLLKLYPASERPWSRININFITGLLTTSEGYDYIIIMINAYTKITYFETTTFKGLNTKKTVKIIY